MKILEKSWKNCSDCTTGADSAAYLPWCYTIFPFEHPVEIRQIWESAFLWDFKNRIIGRCEHCACFCDTEVIHIWDKAHSGMDLKKFHKMRWTIVAEICNFFDGYIFIIMRGDIPDDTFQFLFMLIALRRLVYFWRVRLWHAWSWQSFRLLYSTYALRNILSKGLRLALLRVNI